MPVVIPGNAFLLGIAKQTNESTVPGTATYSLPVRGGTPEPTYDLRRIEVTDASSIEGDPYKGPSYAKADSLEFPAFDDSLGTFLVGMWGTDTPSGTVPSRVHTYTGLGGTQPWIALYSHWTDAGINYEQTFGKGLMKSLTFAGNQEGGPLVVTAAWLGQEVTGATTAAFPATTADVLTAGYFTMQHATAKIELDIDSPNVSPSVSVTNIRDFSLTVARDATPEPTATGVTVTNIAQGKVTNTGQLTVLWDSVALDTYRASYFGSAAGTTLSSTVVTGAIKFTFKHSVSATSILTLYIPAVQFQAAPAVPDPSGSALTQTITLNVFKPSSGEHVQPVLTNNVNAAY